MNEAAVEDAERLNAVRLDARRLRRRRGHDGPFCAHSARRSLSCLASFDRQQLEVFVSVAIDLLDLTDGGSDVESNGDEGDYSVADWTAECHGSLDEEAEDDDPAEADDEDCSGVENEPLFNCKGCCARLNRL